MKKTVTLAERTGKVRIESVGALVSRKVYVNRDRSMREAVDATGCSQQINLRVMDAMPLGKGKEVEIFFFIPDQSKYGNFITDDQLRNEYRSHRLRPADPMSLCALNESDHKFVGTMAHGTHWKNANGIWCSISFNGWHGRSVVIGRREFGWRVGRWWFGGLKIEARPDAME